MKLKVLGFFLVSISAFAGDLLSVSFAGPAVAGTAKLDPGVYKVRLSGSVAVFCSTATGKSYSTMVRVEKTDKRSDFTAAVGPTVDGVQRVASIVLEGSDSKLFFVSK